MKRLIGLLLSIILLPISLGINIIVYILLTLTGLLGKVLIKPVDGIEKTKDLSASIVIPSWNGRELLAVCIPAVVEALKYTKGDHEIIVVDNGSTDGSKELLQAQFPQVKVVSKQQNLGFSKAANLGIKSSSKDIIVLLNNDMVVDKNFLTFLLEEFENSQDVFAVTSQIFLWDKETRRVETGKTGACLRNGSIYPWHDENFEPTGVVPVTYAGGGSSAYDRKKLLALGCFDELYSPFYVEDLDLSFMAWKRGWRVLFKPESIVYHKHRGTIGARFKDDYIQSVLRRNEILFVWKNIDSLKSLATHFLWLWLRLAVKTSSGSFAFTKAYFKALASLGTAVKSRFKESREGKVSSKEVFRRSTSLSNYKEAFGPLKVIDRAKPLRVLFVCPYIPFPPSHGGAVRMYNLIKQLAHVHDIYLLSFVENEAELKSYQHLSEICKDVKLIIRRESWRRDKLFWLQPQSSLNEFYSVEFETTLQEIVEKYDIDIVQYEYTQMAQYIKDFPRAKNVLTEHDVTFVTRYRYFRNLPWSKEKLKAFIRWAAMYAYEPEICRKFDLVCAVSSKEKQLLLSYDSKLPVSDAAPTGADTSYYKPEDRKQVEPVSLLFVGFFKHIPNVEGILYFCKEIYPLLKQKIPGVKLYVVGANPPEEVMSLIKDPSIVVTGFVEDLREYYAKSTLFVVPILRGAGTRVKIFEAMAAGIPIVSTTLGAEGIDITNGQDILLADSPEEFSKHITDLVTNSDLQMKVAQNARELVVSKYEWANIARRLAHEYYSLWKV